MNIVEKRLVKILEPKLAEIGFSWINGRNSFLRRRDGGFDRFLWTSYATHDNGGQLELGPAIGVRHDRVENIVNQLGLIYGADNQKFTVTVERGMRYFPFDKEDGNVQFIHFSSVETDLEAVANNMLSIILGDGMRFWEDFACLRRCSEDLNASIETRTHALCNNFPLRAYYGVTCASFEESERVPLLVEQYKKYASEVTPNQLEKIGLRLEKILSIVGGRL